jgi:hypothetical protein
MSGPSLLRCKLPANAGELARASAETSSDDCQDGFDEINQPQKSNDTAKEDTMTSEKWAFTARAAVWACLPEQWSRHW